jgi:hypothetical protein
MQVCEQNAELSGRRLRRRAGGGGEIRLFAQPLLPDNQRGDQRPQNLQHTSANVSMRQHTPAAAALRQPEGRPTAGEALLQSAPRRMVAAAPLGA